MYNMYENVCKMYKKEAYRMEIWIISWIVKKLCSKHTRMFVQHKLNIVAEFHRKEEWNNVHHNSKVNSNVLWYILHHIHWG